MLLGVKGGATLGFTNGFNLVGDALSHVFEFLGAWQSTNHIGTIIVVASKGRHRPFDYRFDTTKRLPANPRYGYGLIGQ